MTYFKMPSYHIRQLVRTGQSASHRFWHDTSAGLSVEVVLIFPMLFWVYAGSFTFFNAYRAQGVNMKAAYSIADIVTRETTPIDMNYLIGMNTVYDFMVRNPYPTWIRVTSISWSAEDDEFKVSWSHATKGQTTWTTNTLNNAHSDQLPILADGDFAVVVEAFTSYSPMFRRSIFAPLIGDVDFENFIVTSPRFVPRVCWETSCFDSL